MTAVDHPQAKANRSGLVGQSVRRVEDNRLLTGHGRFVADVNPPGVLHAVFVRSPLAHARITSIDATVARRAPGVVAVITGAEMAELTHPFPPFLMLPGLYTPLFHALSADKVRLVGDPVAIVLAESRYLAEDAVDLVEVEYEPLPAVADIASALSTSSEPLWAKAGGNVMMDHTDTFGDVDAVFAAADRVITERFECQRQSNQPMETRGSVVEVDAATGHLTIHNATQSSHALRWAVAALTGKQSVAASLKRFVTDKQRRGSFLAGAKQFVGANREALKEQDNAGPKSQLKKDRSFLVHLNKISLGLLGKDDYPTVKAQDIGGGFGSKGAISREDIAVAAAATSLGRSVRWIEDRTENLMDGGQAREESITMSVAVDDDGTFRAMRVDLIVDQGAYPGFPIGAPLITKMMKTMFPGSYRWDAYEIRSRIVATNKGKYIPYRGPWANETWARERMVDVVADVLGRSPADLRLQNLIDSSDLPTTMISGPTVDETMSTKQTLVRALELVDFDQFERDRAAAAERGHRLGLGIASYHEAAPGPPGYWDCVNPGTGMLTPEEAHTTIEADGSVVIYTQQMPHGQSHETTYAQVAADELGVRIEDIKLVSGDTDRTPFGIAGTGGSRGGPIGGGVVRKTAREVRRQLIDAASRMLEAAPEDIEIIDGNIHVAGVPDRGVTFAAVAQQAASEGAAGALHGSPFEVSDVYDGAGDGGWSVATHLCIVDIDLGTGMVTFPRYLVVEDCGPIINPAIVDGQVRGGVAQGIGAVLYERTTYDEDANLQSATYMDYLMPTAMEIPEIEVHHLETLSPGENDFRGVGEGGMIGAPAAITNAIEHALGVRVTTQYLPPTKILELAGILPIH